MIARFDPAPHAEALLSRRQTLAFGVAAACFPVCDCANAQPAPTTPLKQIAKSRGIVFGSEIHGGLPGFPGVSNSFDDAAQRALVLRECAAIEPGNEMKWPVMEPQPGQVSFSLGDRLTAFAEANGLGLRGINVVWMNAKNQPQWLDDVLAGSNRAVVAEKLLRQRALQLCGHYGDRIFSWDTVNEAIDDITGQPRPSALASALGGIEPVMDIVFHSAREAAPHAELVYNDFMSWHSTSAKHRAGVLKVLEGFRKRGTPVDTLGLQSHILTVMPPNQSGEVPAQPAEWRAFLEEVTAMGYRLVITEFDVNDRNLPILIQQRDQAVADMAERYLDLTLSFPQLHTFMTWGLVDRYSWYQFIGSRWNLVERRPCPYDDSLRPKPLRAAIARALAGAPVRPESPASRPSSGQS